MGFKIRNKALFMTPNGLRNNYYSRTFAKQKFVGTEKIFNNNHPKFQFSHLRFLQSYRNYSRMIKGYLYGNDELIQCVLAELREQFHIPFTCTSQLSKFTVNLENRLANSLDRDYQQITYNTHSGQLHLYETVNKFIRRETKEQEYIDKGEDTLFNTFQLEVEKEVNREMNRNGGEKLSLEKLAEVIMRTGKNLKQYMGQRPVKKENGEFDDLLEKRKPFMDIESNGPSS